MTHISQESEVGGQSLKDRILSALGAERPSSAYEHSYGVELTSRLARNFGVAITEKDTAFWKAIFNATRVIDDLVDDAGATNVEDSLDALIRGEVIEGIDAPTAQHFSDVFANLDTDRQEILYQEIAALPWYAQQQRQAVTYDEYVILNRAEAAMFARIISLPVDLNAPDSIQRMNFNEWLHQFSQSAYSLDNVFDMRKDYENGVNPLKPGFKSAVLLASTAFMDIARSIEQSPVSTYVTIASVQSRKYLAKLR